MAKEKTVKVVLLLRKDSLANWQSNNPVLRSGEMSYVTDLGRCKIGDGVTHWNDLPYFALQTDLDDLDFATDYERLINKPKIESIELMGNKNFEDLGLEECSNDDILAMFQ